MHQAVERGAPLTAPGSGATAAAPDTTAGVHARRVIFIDLARALAVLLMVYGHTSDALLDTQYRTGAWFEAWQFQRGLTSSLFMLLSGFAFSIATTRHWANHMTFSPKFVKRMRRFGLFILLGYALHFPVGYLWSIVDLDEPSWRMFLAVDVLQNIGGTFVLVQALAMLTRSRRLFMWVSFVLSFTIILATPMVWRYDWTQRLPLWLAGYLYPGTGSQFPLFPFAASVLFGAALGQVYARWGASHLGAFANYAMLGTGLLLTAIGYSWRITRFDPYGPGEGQYIPGEYILRTGVTLLIIGAVAHVSRYIERLPHIFGAVAQESLLIYFVHLCIVYGSAWNSGLVQNIGTTLAPAEELPIVLAVIVPMILMAWYWNWYKHHRPRGVRYVILTAWSFLVAKLLV